VIREQLSTILLLAGLLAMPGLGFSQAAERKGNLTVAGQQGQVPIIQLNGKSYVDVEALARLTNSSLKFNGNDILWALSSSDAGAAAAAANPPAVAGFSKEFMKAGVELGSSIREWRTALSSAVQNGYPVTEELVASYRGQAATNLRLASVAVSTDADRSVFELLGNIVGNMQKLSNKFVAARKNMDYLSADALRDDPLNQQILGCARSLVSMAASGQFQDDGSCH
jgi:hypothetical protein